MLTLPLASQRVGANLDEVYLLQTSALIRAGAEPTGPEPPFPSCCPILPADNLSDHSSRVSGDAARRRTRGRRL